MQLAEQRMKKPNGSIGESCGSKAATKAAYRLLDNDSVEGKAIQGSHYRATARRAQGQAVLLAVQDTTQLDYTRHQGTKGLGYLQDLSHQGMLVHTTMVVSPERVPYGVIQQQVWIRPVEGYQKKRQRRQRSISQKESQKWLTSLEAASWLQAEIPDSHIVSVGDSEADVFDLFLKTEELKLDLLIRACQDRRVEPSGKLLWNQVKKQTVAGEIIVQVPRQAGKRARKATLTVRFCQVKLRPPKSRYQEKMPTIQLRAVYAQEERPPQGQEAIEWLLLTTLAVTSFSDACQRIQWYTCRWVIEMYHKVLKSGCRVEERQFADFENLKRYLALDAIIAWRVLYLTLLGRNTPDLPCSLVLETHEWQALFCFIHQSNQPPQVPPSLLLATLWIAQLGGFLARKSDGSPGTKSIWLGLQRLSDIADAWLFFSPPAICG